MIIEMMIVTVLVNNLQLQREDDDTFKFASGHLRAGKLALHTSKTADPVSKFKSAQHLES